MGKKESQKVDKKSDPDLKDAKKPDETKKLKGLADPYILQGD